MIPPDELLELRLEGRSTTAFDRTLPKTDDRAVPDETVLPGEVKGRLLESTPAGLLRVPLDTEPLSLMVAREPAPESVRPEGDEDRPARPTLGRTVGCAAFRLMRPRVPSSEDLSACREIAGDCRRSLRTTVRAREFQG